MLRKHHNTLWSGILFRSVPRVLAASVAMLLAAHPAQAQFPPNTPGPQANGSPQGGAQSKSLSGPPARAPDKLYAFSGTWASDDRVNPIVGKGAIPFDDAHEAIRAQLEKNLKAGIPLDGNEPKCIPNGPVMSMATPGGVLTISATAAELTILADKIRRHILIDKKHTPDNLLFDSYAGESVAHWEGNDLVVDTVAVKPELEITWGIPLGERSKFHMVERFRIVGPSKMEIETVIEDPGVLTKPWKFTRHYSRAVPSSVENFCLPAADRDRDSATGEPGLDLTPPKGTRYIPPGAEK
jgi:hypothetical protein